MAKRQKTIVGVAVAALVLAVTSVAVAQSGGSGGGSTNEAATDVLNTTECGADIKTFIKTESSPSSTSSLSFVTLNTSQAVTISSNSGGCIKVLFTGESSCGATGVVDNCFIRATANGTEMTPQGGGTQLLDSESTTARSRSAAWGKRLAKGTYNIQIQRKVGNSNTVFTLDDWVIDIRLTA